MLFFFLLFFFFFVFFLQQVRKGDLIICSFDSALAFASSHYPPLFLCFLYDTGSLDWLKSPVIFFVIILFDSLLK